jgi:MFS family permease
MAMPKQLAKPPQWLANSLKPYQSMGTPSRRMALVLFLWGMGEGMWMYIRPLYVTALGGTVAQAGIVLAIAGIAPVLLMLPAGRLVDRFGPRHVMLLTWWIGTISAVMLALAGNWQWAIPGFFLYAVSSLAIPAINAYVALDVGQQSGHEDTAQTIQTVVSSVFVAYFAGIIIAPVIGGWLGETLGLRSVFWVSGGWFLLSTLLVHGLPVLHSPLTTAPSVEGETQPAAPALPWWRFSGVQMRIFLTLLVLFFLMGMGYTFVPNYLEDVRGLSLGIIGGLGTATASGGVLWLLVLGGRRSRDGLIISALLMAGAFGLLLFSPAGAGQLLFMIPVYFMLGVIMTVRTLSLGIVNAYTPLAQRGTAYGMIETVYGVSLFLGPWVAGLLYSRSPDLPFVLAAVLLILLLGVLFVTLKPAPAPPPEE